MVDHWTPVPSFPLHAQGDETSVYTLKSRTLEVEPVLLSRKVFVEHIGTEK